MWKLALRLVPGAIVLACAVVFLGVLHGYAAGQQCGVASWYGPGFHGKRTASGEIYNQNAMTAAHRSLPFGSRVRVTLGKRSVIVRISDRGPYHGGRVIDLSRAAAAKLGMIHAGTGRVCLVRL